MKCEKCGGKGYDGVVVNMADSDEPRVILESSVHVTERELRGGATGVLCTSCVNLWTIFVRGQPEYARYCRTLEYIEWAKACVCANSEQGITVDQWHSLHDNLRRAEAALFDVATAWLAEKIPPADVDIADGNTKTWPCGITPDGEINNLYAAIERLRARVFDLEQGLLKHGHDIVDGACTPTRWSEKGQDDG